MGQDLLDQFKNDEVKDLMPLLISRSKAFLTGNKCIKNE
jgi:hypothetical protein